MKTPPAGLLECGFGPVRAIRRGLHLFQQVSITTALPRVLGKWPCDSAELGQVGRVKFRPARFQAHGRGGIGRFPRWHLANKCLNIARRNPLPRYAWTALSGAVRLRPDRARRGGFLAAAARLARFRPSRGSGLTRTPMPKALRCSGTPAKLGCGRPRRGSTSRRTIIPRSSTRSKWQGGAAQGGAA
jgi:hypothetical protein